MNKSKNIGLGYMAEVELKFDVKKQRGDTLEFCEFIKTVYSELIGIPNLFYKEEGEGNLFYFSKERDILVKFKREVENKGLAKKVILRAVEKTAFERTDL